MAFFKFRWPLGGASKGRDERPPASSQGDSVEVLRRRARHRLIGAAVLVLAGVLGFPLLFDTQPRPIPVDIPIAIPDKNKSPALSLPTPPVAVSSASDSGIGPDEEVVSSSSPRTETRAAVAKPAAEPRKEAPKAEPKSEVKVEAKTEAKSEPKPEHKDKPEARAERKPDPKPESKPEPKPEARAVAKAEPKPEPKPEPKSDAKSDGKAADDAARARALLEGKSAADTQHAPAAADSARFIVQVGAFSDATKARDARLKLEKAGLKTYTQVIETGDGKRIRVRVGPFAGKAEADKAASRIKSLDLPASILTL